MSINPNILDELESDHDSSKPIYTYCPLCKNKAWLDIDHVKHHQNGASDSINIEGVAVIEDVIDANEEDKLMSLIDSPTSWKPSQEGRCKQDFGPRVNFLAKKASIGNFVGFPAFACDILSRLQKEHKELLGDFIPVEFCILEYVPERGSYIRPHYDDTWIWGDRLVTVNLLSETILRLTKEFNTPPYEIAIRMPAKSLIIIYGEARYAWHHSINRFDISSRRIAMTWREFSQEIMQDKQLEEFVDDAFRISKIVI